MHSIKLRSVDDLDRLGLWAVTDIDPRWSDAFKRTTLGVAAKYVDWDSSVRRTVATERINYGRFQWSASGVKGFAAATYVREFDMGQGNRPHMFLSRYLMGTDVDERFAMEQHRMLASDSSHARPTSNIRQAVATHEVLHPVALAGVSVEPVSIELNYSIGRILGPKWQEMRGATAAKVASRLGWSAASNEHELYAEGLRVWDEFGDVDALSTAIGTAFDRWMTRTAPGAKRLEELLVGWYEGLAAAAPGRRATCEVKLSEVPEWAEQWNQVARAIDRGQRVPRVEPSAIDLSGRLSGGGVDLLQPQPISRTQDVAEDEKAARALFTMLGGKFDGPVGAEGDRLSRPPGYEMSMTPAQMRSEVNAARHSRYASLSGPGLDGP